MKNKIEPLDQDMCSQEDCSYCSREPLITFVVPGAVAPS